MIVRSGERGLGISALAERHDDDDDDDDDDIQLTRLEPKNIPNASLQRSKTLNVCLA